MHLSTRGRYAVMAMIDLAVLQNETGTLKPVTLAEIADRQDLSLSYLEQLFAKLRRADLVKSVRGPGGGYLLNKESQETWLGDIIHAVDEEVNLTRCGNSCDLTQPKEKRGCVRGEQCNAHDIWVALSNHMMGFLAQVSVDMVISGAFDIDAPPQATTHTRVQMTA